MNHLRKPSVLPGTMIPFLLCCCILLSPHAAHAAPVTKLNSSSVALTFDACETKTPSYFDEKILSYLIDQKIPFTVFVTGKFAKRNRARLKEISKFPFVEIENHSFLHRQHMERLSAAEIKKEVSGLDDLIKKLTGKRTKYFRFPAGNYDAKTLRIVEGMKYKAVFWSYESGDPNKNFTPATLTDRVTSKTQAGDILIFHINGRGYSTGEALPVIIQNLQEKGFSFVKLEDGGL